MRVHRNVHWPGASTYGVEPVQIGFVQDEAGVDV